MKRFQFLAGALFATAIWFFLLWFLVSVEQFTQASILEQCARYGVFRVNDVNVLCQVRIFSPTF